MNTYLHPDLKVASSTYRLHDALDLCALLTARGLWFQCRPVPSEGRYEVTVELHCDVYLP